MDSLAAVMPRVLSSGAELSAAGFENRRGCFALGAGAVLPILGALGAGAVLPVLGAAVCALASTRGGASGL